MKKLNLLFLLLILCVGLFAQDSTSIIDMSNNLGLVNGTKTINKGAIFAGVAYYQAKMTWDSPEIGSTEYIEYSLPGLVLGYGIGERIDLRVSGNFMYSAWESDVSSGTDFNSFNIDFASKINIVKQKGWIPEVAIDAGLRIISGLRYFPIGLVFKYDLGNRLNLSGGLLSQSNVPGGAMSIIDRRRDRDITKFKWALESSFDITHHLGIHVSVRTWNPMYFGTYWNTGLFYQFKNKMLLFVDFRKFTVPKESIYNLDNKRKHHNINAGFSWLMFNK